MGMRPKARAGAITCWLILAAGAVGAAQDANEPPSLQLQMNVDRLLVPVVVRDRHGQTINDLAKEDFQVFDNGKLRSVSAFSVERRRSAIGAQAPSPGEASTAAAIPGRVTVFIFDDMHLSVEDLAHARAAGTNVIAGALTGNDMAAVVSVSGRVNSGLTRDRAVLQQALAQLTPRAVFRTEAADCPSLDYYEADLIENKHDPVAVQDAVQKYINCHPAIANPSSINANLPNAEGLVDAAALRALAAGRQDVQTTFAGIAAFIKRMTKLPGTRTLVLVSPGFLNIERESLDMESQMIDLAARSSVTVSALDARGLYTTDATASQGSPALAGRSLQVNSDLQRSTMKQSENVMAELADGTGGTFFHSSNDLATGLKELTEAPETLYVLELPIGDVKRNGTFHRLNVKVSRDGAQIAARRGYFVPKPDKKAK